MPGQELDPLAIGCFQVSLMARQEKDPLTIGCFPYLARSRLAA